MATGGSETSDRSELGERLGLGVGGDISPVAGQMNKLLNDVMCDVRGRDVRANTLGLSPMPDPGRRKVHWVIRDTLGSW